MGNKKDDNEIVLAPLGNIDILWLVDVYGEDRARLFLQDYFAKKENFFAFTSIFSDMMPDAVPDIHRIAIAEAMRGGRFALALPRGGAKSTVISVFFAMWLALNGKRNYILEISDTHTQAAAFVGTIKTEIENNPLLRFVYPQARGEFWTADKGIVVVSPKGHQCKIQPIGSGMKVRGLNFQAKRPDQLLIDDLENSEGVYSLMRRKKLKRWFDMDLEPAMDRYAKNIVYIGTILHYNALFKLVLDKKDKYGAWRTMMRKAIDNGKSFWEARFSLEYLTAIRDDTTHPDYVGSIVFAQEYQHEPQDDQDRVIKFEWIKEYTIQSKINEQVAVNNKERQQKWLNTLERVGAVDPAISESEGADFFSIYVMGFEKSTGNEYMLDLLHEKSNDPSKQTQWVCDMVEKWELNMMGIETVAFQAGLATLVRKELQRRRIYCRIVPIRTDKDKIRRARIHSVAFEGGFVHLRSDHPKCDIIKQEIMDFPLGEHDDAFDALMLAREVRKKPRARALRQKPTGF